MKATLNRLSQGGVDLLIGTHRLLQKDVHFKNLGLLVVDEEQRFGVTHKEKLKELARQVKEDYATKRELEKGLSGQLTEDNAMSVVDIIKIMEE